MRLDADDAASEFARFAVRGSTVESPRGDDADGSGTEKTRIRTAKVNRRRNEQSDNNKKARRRRILSYLYLQGEHVRNDSIASSTSYMSAIEGVVDEEKEEYDGAKDIEAGGAKTSPPLVKVEKFEKLSACFFSVGFDAIQFHQFREKTEKCCVVPKTVSANVAGYGVLGALEWLAKLAVTLHRKPSSFTWTTNKYRSGAREHHPNLQHPLFHDRGRFLRLWRKVQTARALARLPTAVCPRRLSRSRRHVRRRPPLRHSLSNDALPPLGARQESRNRLEATVAGSSGRRAVVKSTGEVKVHLRSLLAGGFRFRRIAKRVPLSSSSSSSFQKRVSFFFFAVVKTPRKPSRRRKEEQNRRR